MKLCYKHVCPGVSYKVDSQQFVWSSGLILLRVQVRTSSDMGSGGAGPSAADPASTAS